MVSFQEYQRWKRIGSCSSICWLFPWFVAYVDFVLDCVLDCVSSLFLFGCFFLVGTCLKFKEKTFLKQFVISQQLIKFLYGKCTTTRWNYNKMAAYNQKTNSNFTSLSKRMTYRFDTDTGEMISLKKILAECCGISGVWRQNSEKGPIFKNWVAVYYALLTAVFFNRSSTEPQGSANVCQGSAEPDRNCLGRN